MKNQINRAFGTLYEMLVMLDESAGALQRRGHKSQEKYHIMSYF